MSQTFKDFSYLFSVNSFLNLGASSHLYDNVYPSAFVKTFKVRLNMRTRGLFSRKRSFAIKISNRLHQKRKITYREKKK